MTINEYTQPLTKFLKQTIEIEETITRKVKITKEYQETKPIEYFLDKVIQGDALEVLKTMPSNSVDCIITSPPYWLLRWYGESTNKIWDGDPNCNHTIGLDSFKHFQREPSKTGIISDKTKFGQCYRNEKSGFCSKCGAWYGQLGLEPTLDLYINHLLQITAELKRVLKPTGVMWWNHGDSYSGDMGKRSGWSYVSGISDIDNEEAMKRGISLNFKPKYNIPQKSLCLQNYRLIQKMIDEQGWILRDTIIWAKKIWVANENDTIGNAMPSSVKDRCSYTYEPVFMLVKSNKPVYYYNIKTGLMSDKKPPKEKQREGIDWGWGLVGVYDENSFNVRVRDSEKGKFLQKATPSEIARKYGYDPDGICPICGRTWKRHASPNAKDRKEGIKREFLPCVKIKQSPKPQNKKISYWHSLHYWFDQQILKLPQKESTFQRAQYPISKFGGNPNQPMARLSKGMISGAEQTYIKPNPLGANRPNVWLIGTEPFHDAHFAVFPSSLVEPLIKCSCPRWICRKCGNARVRITKQKRIIQQSTSQKMKKLTEKNPVGHGWYKDGYKGILVYEYHTIGWTNCSCNLQDKWRPGIVLDPFAGSGTTLVVAKRLCRHYIGIELNPDYVKMAKRRLAKEPEKLTNFIVQSSDISKPGGD